MVNLTWLNILHVLLCVMATVAAINSLYVSLASPPLQGWKPVGGDPCLELWQGVACVFSNITAMYVHPPFLKLLFVTIVLLFSYSR